MEERRQEEVILCSMGGEEREMQVEPHYIDLATGIKRIRQIGSDMTRTQIRWE